MVVLEYDFSNIYYREGVEIVKINIPKFKFKVNESGDLDKLHDKYYDEALCSAAYQVMDEYANFIVNSL